MTQPVAHWGLHESGDLLFLHEQTRSRCLTPGVEGLESPFEVFRQGTLRCPHGLLPMGDFPPDPPPYLGDLIHKLSPVPDGGAYWVPLDAKPVIQAAHSMCSPLRSIAFVPWAHPLRTLVPELTVTNLAPLIISDYEAKEMAPLSRFLNLPRTRTVILCGSMRLPNTVRLPDWSEQSLDHDWPLVGRALLMRWIRGKLKL